MPTAHHTHTVPTMLLHQSTNLGLTARNCQTTRTKTNVAAKVGNLSTAPQIPD
jgi:hypothetical protein